MPVLIPLIVVGLEAIVVWVVAFGARQSWGAFAAGVVRLIHSPKSVIKWLFSWTSVVGITKEAQDTLSHGEDALGKAAQGAEPTTAGFIVGTGAAIDYHAFTTSYLADGVLDALGSIKAHSIPAGVKAGTATAREQSEAASKRSRAAERGATAAEAAAIAARKAAARAEGRAKVAQHDALAATGAIAVPAPWALPRVRNKEIADRVTSWFSKYRKAIIAGLGAAVFAGVVVHALTRVMPWFKCGNVNKAARHVCRMPTRWLDDLLALTADFFILSNICSVVPWLETAYADIGEPLVEKLSEVASRVCNPARGTPAHIDGPALHLPPVTFSKLYLP